jgi:hypothetical protein
MLDGTPLHDAHELRTLTSVYRGGAAYGPSVSLAQTLKSEAVNFSM